MWEKLPGRGGVQWIALHAFVPSRALFFAYFTIKLSEATACMPTLITS
jgi:hypothetical protein